ncbi:MAG TPA: hypothetical protein DIV41_04695 [Ruminococcaceae bacterium]|jgi:CxxC motif-containing protein|nr:hypothetical protein [Oscillospiraceae bacterium]
MEKEITCIGCPMGCSITADIGKDGKINSLSGYSCGVGKKYAYGELTLPKRMVTSLVYVRGTNKPLPVKTSAPITKSKIPECLGAIRSVSVTAPVRVGDIIIKNVLGEDADIVATGEII